MSTILSEKVTSELEAVFYILPETMPKTVKRTTLGEFVNSAMNKAGLKQTHVEEKSKAEAEARGLDPKEYSISNSTVGGIISETPQNLGMRKLMALSWAIDKPLEQLVQVAFELDVRLNEFQDSAEFELWDLRSRLTNEKDKDYFDRKISDLIRELSATLPRVVKKKN